MFKIASSLKHSCLYNFTLSKITDAVLYRVITHQTRCITFKKHTMVI